MVSFLDVTGIKPCPDLSSNQNSLRIASSTEPTLIRKEDTTPLISCPVFVLSAPLMIYRSSPAVVVLAWPPPTVLTAVPVFPSARNDTFVDSELCSYTGDGTPLLQLPDNFSTCEVVEVNIIPYMALLVENLIETETIQHTKWPAFSNDLDRIKHVWTHSIDALLQDQGLLLLYKTWRLHFVKSETVFPKVSLINNLIASI
ncbi:hypothetical protein TNCV_404281 [Trichonephila clavipes]|nr:hypothetical protein TNCV_404281 [Trichonephila clavipes]